MASFQPTEDNISIVIETVNIFDNDSLFKQMGKMCQEYIWENKAYVYYILYNEFAFDDYDEYIKNEDSIENIIKATHLKKNIDEMTRLMKYYYQMAIKYENCIYAMNRLGYFYKETEENSKLSFAYYMMAC